MKNLNRTIWIIGILVILFSHNSRAVDLNGSLFSHDPATITKDGDNYWHFYTAPGIGAAYSKDLKNWTSSNNHIFTPGSNWKTNYPAWTIPFFGSGTNANTDGNLWAPDVIYMNGAYYLYYSCSSFGSSTSAIGVVKSPSLNSPAWEDLGMVVSSDSRNDINAIDPGLFRDDDGKIYMVYGSWHGGIGIVDIDSVTGLATTSVTHLYGGGGQAMEAPALFKENGYYYLVVNRGTCCNGINSSYYITVGRSTNVKGPYENFRTLLPNKSGKYIGPGHFSLLRDSCANYVSIHYYNGNSNGFPTFDILKMKMVDDWPVLYRNFTFDNCNDELRINAGSDGTACMNLAFDLNDLSTDPYVMFYSSLLWDDGNTGGSFDDTTVLEPVYYPPEGYSGDITLTLTGVGEDSVTVNQDSLLLNIIENNIEVDLGPDRDAKEGVTMRFEEMDSPPTASGYNRLYWDDGGAGGRFVNKTVLDLIYTPPLDYSGPIVLTLTAYGESNCVASDSTTLSVTLPIEGIIRENIAIYPNPSENGSFAIDFRDYISQEDVKIEFYNTAGIKVVSFLYRFTSKLEINPGLSEGLYLLKIRTGDFQFTDKILIK